MKRLAAILLLSAVLPASLSLAARQPFADDLAADAALAEQHGVPIVIMFSASYCNYCEDLRAGVIDGMAVEGIYQDRVIVRVVQTDGSAGLVGFDGRRTSHAEFARRNRVSFTPVVRIFGPRGQVLVKDIEGVPNLDFYSYYLDESIDAARKVLRTSRHARR